MTKAEQQQRILNGWRQDKRLVFLANAGRDLTAAERGEWEQRIRKYQVVIGGRN
jgi:hypothetical protein